MPVAHAGKSPPPKRSSPLSRTRIGIVAGIVLTLLSASVYWAVLLGSHERQLQIAQEQTWLRAGQMSRAVSVQVATMLSDLDHSMRTMQADFEAGNQGAFELAVKSVFDSYPGTSIVQIAVADKGGKVLSTTVRGEMSLPNAVSIADREHFLVHQQQKPAGLYIGRPVQGRISGLWTIQLSRALHRHGEFSGVLVLSLSPDYIGNYFRSIFEGSEDVIALLRDDGIYLAHSKGQTAVLGQALPTQLLTLSRAAGDRGTYETMDSDGIQRIYAWSHSNEFPLIVGVGIEKEGVLAPLEETLRRSLIRNGAGTFLIFCGVALTVWLALLKLRTEDRNQENERRLSELSQEVPGGLFQFMMSPSGHPSFPFTNPSFFELHCLRPPARGQSAPDLLQRVHPEDVAGLKASVERAIRHRQMWEHKYRIMCPDRRLRWLSGHANPADDPEIGMVWHGYIHDVSSDQLLKDALKASEERLQRTIAAVGDGIWRWNCERDEVVWDDRCFAMLGYTDVRPDIKSVRDFITQIHPKDRDRAQTKLDRHLQIGEPYRVEMRLATSNGDWLWVEARGDVTLRDSSGLALRMEGTHSDIDKRVQQSQLVNALLDRSSAIVLVASPQRTILYCNERASKCFGLPLGKSPPGLAFRFLHMNDASYAEFGDLYNELRQKGAVRVEWAMRLPSGKPHWFHMQGSLLDPEDKDGNVIWTLLDVDARHRAEAALEKVQQRLEAIIEHFPSGILVADAEEHRVLAANQTLATTLGLPNQASEWIGGPLDALVRSLPASIASIIDEQTADKEHSDLRSGQRSTHLLPNGRHVEIEHLPLSAQGLALGQCWVFHDVSEFKQRESDLVALASTDVLTGISNRRAFLLRMDRELERLRLREVEQSSLIMIDVDHFKRVNDTYGHAIGDLVLKHLVRCIGAQLRKEDMLGRLGGEEFAVLLSGAGQEPAMKRAETLRAAIQRNPAMVDGMDPIHFTVSLGVYVMRDGHNPVDTCLERSDAALYYSKRTGRNRTTCWRSGLPEISNEACVS